MHALADFSSIAKKNEIWGEHLPRLHAEMANDRFVLPSNADEHCAGRQLLEKSACSFENHFYNSDGDLAHMPVVALGVASPVSKTWFILGAV